MVGSGKGAIRSPNLSTSITKPLKSLLYTRLALLNTVASANVQEKSLHGRDVCLLLISIISPVKRDKAYLYTGG